jgi:hypothetical protein
MLNRTAAMRAGVGTPSNPVAQLLGTDAIAPPGIVMPRAETGKTSADLKSLTHKRQN